MDLKDLNELKEKRRAIRPLLKAGDPTDAQASYYALWHDPRRTGLMVHYDARQRADGFVAICQTGADLFRPLVVARAEDEAIAGALLRSTLDPRRTYQVIVPLALASAVREVMDLSRSSQSRVYRLDASRFQPIINVLVQRVDSPDGVARFQIESQGQIMAMSGTNWRSPDFGEVFVYVHPRGRGRGWGKSVVSACTTHLLEERLRPLYMVDEKNDASVHIAEGLGYVDTGQRDFVGEGQLA